MRAGEVAILADPNYNGDMSSLDVDVQDSAHWHYENMECTQANGHNGCAWTAYSQDDPIDLTAYSKEYNLALEYGTEANLACSELVAESERDRSFCPLYGFTKYDEDSEDIEFPPCVIDKAFSSKLKKNNNNLDSNQNKKKKILIISIISGIVLLILIIQVILIRMLKVTQILKIMIKVKRK